MSISIATMGMYNGPSVIQTESPNVIGGFSHAIQQRKPLVTISRVKYYTKENKSVSVINIQEK